MSRPTLSRRLFLSRSVAVLGYACLGLAAACAPAAPPPSTPAAAPPTALPQPTVAAASKPTAAPPSTSAPATTAPTAAAAPTAVAVAQAAELRIDVTADPLSLDPLRFNGFSIQRVYRLIYNQLLKWNEDGTITPDLAAAMPDISSDGLTYTFKLRKGVKWHDGNDFDAQDVKFSYDTVKTPGSASFWARGFAPVESTRTAPRFSASSSCSSPRTLRV
jgi:ABC-type transport system substrate-binding protein